MSLRIILSSVIFIALAIYFTLMNPGDISLRLSQSRPPIQIPLVAFLLFSVLVGFILASVLIGFTRIRQAFLGYLQSRSAAQQARREKHAEKLFHKAESALEGGHHDKGLNLLKKALKDDPHHLPSLILLGNQYREAGRLEEALACHQTAVDHDPENARALQCLAEDFVSAGQSERALEFLKQARHQEPESLAILRKLRTLYQDQGTWNLVLQTQKSILSHVQDPEERRQEKSHASRLAYLNAEQLIQQNQTEPAISELRRAIKEDSKQLPPYILLGDLYRKDNNTRAAAKTWKSGLEATGSHICLHRLRALYESLGKAEEVIKLYQGVLSTSQNSRKESLALELAELFLDQGNMEEAIQTLWQITSPSIPAHLLLIKAHQDKNEAEKADSVIRAALKKITDSMSQYVCRECRREFEQWEGTCPECRAWDSFDSALHKTL